MFWISHIEQKMSSRICLIGSPWERQSPPLPQTNMRRKSASPCVETSHREKWPPKSQASLDLEQHWVTSKLALPPWAILSVANHFGFLMVSCPLSYRRAETPTCPLSVNHSFILQGKNNLSAMRLQQQTKKAMEPTKYSICHAVEMGNLAPNLLLQWSCNEMEG